MDRQTSARRTIPPCRPPHADFRRVLGVRFWLQAMTSMPNADPTVATARRHCRDRARPMCALHVVADAVANRRGERGVLGEEVAGTGQNKRPGEFDGRRRGVARMSHLTWWSCAAVRSIEALRARWRQSAEPGEALDEGARQRRPLAHHAQDVEWPARRSTTASEPARWSLNTVTVARASSTDQSASEKQL